MPVKGKGAAAGYRTMPYHWMDFQGDAELELAEFTPAMVAMFSQYLLEIAQAEK